MPDNVRDKKFTHGKRPNKYSKGPTNNKDKGARPIPANLEPQDPFFYAHSEEAIKNMANIPFMEVVGNPIFRGSSVIPDVAPTALIINYKQSVGSHFQNTPDEKGGDYLTRSAVSYYNYVMSGFTTSVADMEACDLMMIAIAEAAIPTLINEGKRAYAALNYYLPLNRSWAKGIVESLGFNFDNLSMNQAEFRTRLNLIIEQYNKSFALPKKFMVLNRWAFIARNLFVDSESPDYTAVMAYRCTHYLRFDPIICKTGSCLRWVPASDRYTIAGYFELLGGLMDALLDDSDVRSVNAAVKRVYGDGELVKLTPIAENEPQYLQRHDIVSAQIHNMCTWGQTSAASEVIIGHAGGVITTSGQDRDDIACFQDANKIYSELYMRADQTGRKVPGTSGNDQYLIDMYDKMVTPGNILDVTTNMAVLGSKEFTLKEVKYVSYYCRCEAVTSIVVTAYDSSGVLQRHSVSEYLTIQTDTAFSIESDQLLLSHIDCHPLLKVIEAAGSTIVAVAGEVDRYTCVSGYYLIDLHDRTKFQLFMLPENDKFLT